jgi:hypothetical protein
MAVKKLIYACAQHVTSGFKCKEAKKSNYSPRRALAYMNRHSITCQRFICVRELTVAMQEKGKNIPV